MEHLYYLCFVFVMFSCLFLVVTCGERADLLALLYVIFYCVFVTFPCGVLGQVWCLIVSIPHLSHLFYFENQFVVFLRVAILHRFYCMI